METPPQVDFRGVEPIPESQARVLSSASRTSKSLDDAFKRARRRLQDQVRRMRGQIKAYAAQPIGTVAKLWPELGYGFVLGGDGREIYFHRNSVDAFDRLAIGARVAYSEEDGADGPQASRLTLLGS